MSILIATFSILLVCIIGWMLLRGKIPDGLLKFSLNQLSGEIIADYGMIGENTLKTSVAEVKQTVKLLKCKKNNEEFFVLETTSKTLLSIEVYWTKIDEPMFQKLVLIHQQEKPSLNKS